MLLSHHHHSDNLDPAGRAFLPSAKRVLSTIKAAEELEGNVVGMEPWSQVELESASGGSVKVTAVQLSKFDGAYLTLSADHAADVAQILGARVVIPLHFEGWAHFTQGADELTAAFSGNGIRDRLLMLERGQRADV